MDPSTSMNETPDATAIFAPLWRRKWLILAVGIIVAAASYLYYKHQRPTYQATTQVFLGAGAEEQAPTERTANKGRGNALADQAAVINTIVVEQVRQQLTAGHKRALARGTKVKAKSNEKSEFISITTEAHSGKGAALLANLTAQTYVKRQKDKRRRGIEKAIAINRRQLRRIEQSAIAKDEQPAKKSSGSSSAASGAGSTSTSTSTSPTPSGSSTGSTTSTTPARSNESASNVIQEANLSSKINQLESSLETASAQQVKPAKAGNSQLLSPKPRKDAIFGFVLGIVLAAIAAYAFSRFDRRLRSLSRIEAAIGLPLLAALPKVRRPIVRGGQSPRPSVHLLEPLRRLQTALQLTDGARSQTAPASRPRVVVFVSPDPGDGKSTIVADLALVLRDGGERVVIVEANFRRPVQDRLLGLEEQGGLAAALTGRLDVEQAMQRVAPALGTEAPVDQGGGGHAVATAVQARVGSLFLLAGDRSVPNPPTLLGQESTLELLRSLAEKFDYVLIDAPSPLEVSDVVPLLGAVDGIVVVARAGHSRDASAERLRELLAGPSRAPVVGLVANFVSSADLKRYGYSSLDGRSWPGAKLTGR
jgi:polysaccharide biosynthesis transport protein